MQNTANYNLKKPSYTDPADIEDINDNMDVIDQKSKELEDELRYMYYNVRTAILNITTFPDTVINIEKNEEILSATADENGKVALYPTSLGMWKISGSPSGAYIEKNIDIHTITSFSTDMIPATLKVNTEAGAEITATLGSSTMVSVADSNGVATFYTATLGTWMISGTVLGAYVSTTVTIDKIGIFETSLMPATLNAQTLAGTEVNLTKDTITIKVKADETGLAVFRPAIGTWTLSAVFSGVTASKEVNITDTGVYNEGLSPVLADCSWAGVDAFSKAGVASDIWSIGDTKTLTINGVDYVAQIIGFDHDNLTTADGARTKAGVTFQLQNSLNTAYPMNGSNTNSGGWTSSLMRTSTMGTLFNQLDAGLRNVIKPVNKLTSAGSQLSTINTTSDKLFLLSEVEIFGTTTYSKGGEGSQYSYYAAGNSKVKTVNGSAHYWWERSPRGSDATGFCDVYSNGTANISNASASNGVSFGFCI